MANKSTQESVEARIAEVHTVFYELIKINLPDPVQHRMAVEKGVEEVLQNRRGWTTVTPGHFTYTNGLNIFIEPVTPPSTWELISETAKRVLRTELEEIITGAPKNKTREIQKAVDRLMSEYDWKIYFPRKRLT
jgi:hypothetical protein